MTSKKLSLLFAMSTILGSTGFYSGYFEPAKPKSLQGACITMPVNGTAVERGAVKFRAYGCRICHGTDMQMPPGAGRMDLVHAAEVGKDVKGNFIGSAVRYGLPQAQDQMPAYGKVSQEDIDDLAAYIHQTRRDARYVQVMKEPKQGNAAAGLQLFNTRGQCSSCHAPASEFWERVSKYDVHTLESRLLRPALRSGDSKDSAAETAHQNILENYSVPEVQDLVAYLKGKR